MFFCELCKIFKNTFFYGAPPVAASAVTYFREKTPLNILDTTLDCLYNNTTIRSTYQVDLRLVHRKL